MKTNKIVIIGISLIVVLSITVIYLIIDRNNVAPNNSYNQNSAPNYNKSANIQIEINNIESRIRYIDQEISNNIKKSSYLSGSQILQDSNNAETYNLKSEREMLMERLKVLYQQLSIAR